MEFIKVVDGIITDYISSSKFPESEECIEVDDRTFQGYVGLQLNRIDLENGGVLKTDEELIEEGIAPDNRGTYYNIVTGEPFKITGLDIPIPEGYTTLKPEGVNPRWQGEKWVDAGAPPTELFLPVWDEENGWYEGAEIVTEEMKKTRRKSLLNNYMLDLLDEGSYSVEALQKKSSELKELIK